MKSWLQSNKFKIAGIVIVLCLIIFLMVWKSNKQEPLPEKKQDPGQAIIELLAKAGREGKKFESPNKGDAQALVELLKRSSQAKREGNEIFKPYPSNSNDKGHQINSDKIIEMGAIVNIHLDKIKKNEISGEADDKNQAIKIEFLHFENEAISGKFKPPVATDDRDIQLITLLSEELKNKSLNGSLIISNEGKVYNFKLTQELNLRDWTLLKSFFETWKFTPASIDDMPIEVKINLTINFKGGKDE